MSRPSYIKVNLQALVENYHWACSLAPNSNTMAVIKADAYGHGAAACARALAPHAPAFAVACIDEALQLRKANITQPILLLEGQFTEDEIAIAAAENLWLMVEDPWQVDSIAQAQLHEPITVWVKMDTGMHRLGLSTKRFPELLTQLQQSSNVKKDDIVLASHFACADDLNDTFTHHQIKVFDDNNPVPNLGTSLANSAGIMAWPSSHRTWNRAGYMLYGNSPVEQNIETAQGLIPVMSLNSAVVSLRNIEVGEGVGYAQTWHATRPTQVATIAMGYGDGYPRHAPIGTPVLINGQRAPLIGRVSMDMITVDATDISHVEIGSPACCWGETIALDEIATLVGTIGYELITRLGPRLPRIYS